MYRRGWKTTVPALLLALLLAAGVEAQPQRQPPRPAAPQDPGEQAAESGRGAPARPHIMQGMMEDMQDMMEDMQDMMERMRGMMGRRSMGEEDEDEAPQPGAV
jgi:hypothetical protein